MARLRAVQSYPNELFWRFVSRLLDEHGAWTSVPSSDPSASPATVAPGPLVRVGRALLGKHGETPRASPPGGGRAIPEESMTRKQRMGSASGPQATILRTGGPPGWKFGMGSVHRGVAD